jgi:hypothetical protein
VKDEKHKLSDEDLAREALALPRELEAPRDLWVGVRARIEAKQRRTLVMRRTMAGASMLLAAAAVVLSIRAAHQPRVDDRAASVASESPRTAPKPSAAENPEDAVVVPEEATYRAALAALAPSFAERMKLLPEKDVARLGASIQTLNAAIHVTRTSLAEHPEDGDLRGELDSEYEQEIDAMNDVLEWTTRS